MSLSELFTPLEWFFVILLAVIPLVGMAFHLWIMFLGHDSAPPPEQARNDEAH